MVPRCRVIMRTHMLRSTVTDCTTSRRNPDLRPAVSRVSRDLVGLSGSSSAARGSHLVFAFDLGLSVTPATSRASMTARRQPRPAPSHHAARCRAGPPPVQDINRATVFAWRPRMRGTYSVSPPSRGPAWGRPGGCWSRRHPRGAPGISAFSPRPAPRDAVRRPASAVPGTVSSRHERDPGASPTPTSTSSPPTRCRAAGADAAASTSPCCGRPPASGLSPDARLTVPVSRVRRRLAPSPPALMSQAALACSALFTLRVKAPTTWRPRRTGGALLDCHWKRRLALALGGVFMGGRFRG